MLCAFLLSTNTEASTFSRMWLKLSSILRCLFLICIILCTSLRRQKQSTHIFSFMQKNNHQWGTRHDTEWVTKLTCLCDILNLFNELNLPCRGRMQTVLMLGDQVVTFKSKLKFWEQWENIGIFDMDQELVENLNETLSGPLLPSCAWLSMLSFKRVWEILSNHKIPLILEWMNPWLIYELTRWINFVHARSESTVWDVRWQWPSYYIWENSNLHMFWIKVWTRYPETATKHWKACFHF